MSSFFREIRNTFVRGLVVILPIGVTFYILWLIYRLLVSLVDSTFGSFLKGMLGSHWWIPALGGFLTLIVVLTIGLLTRYYVGRALHRYIERVVGTMPIVKTMYSMAKQVVSSLFRADALAFKKVVLIEYPRKGVYTLGFITSEELGKLEESTGEEYVPIYAPTSPNPLSGWFLLVPQDEVIYPDLSVEDGLKLILSGGVVIPERLAVERDSARRKSFWFRRQKEESEEPLEEVIKDSE